MWRSETNQTHESFGIVRKGYDREAVDRLLAELRQQITQASEKITQLETQLAQTQRDYTALREDTRLALSDPERASKLLGQEASEVLKSANDAALGLRRKAESTAKDLVERARREAEEITRQAKLAAETEIEEGRQVARLHLEEVRQQSQEILAMADSTASNTVEAAKREGRSLVFRAREHAANLTQQAENRAAQIREEISSLDLDRQHLIGMLRGAQDLVKNSLLALETPLRSPLASVPRPTPDAEVSDEPSESALSGTEEPEAQEPLINLATTATTDDHRDEIPSQSGLPSAEATGIEGDSGHQEVTLADVARLIELAAQQTAALDLEDDQDASANDATAATTQSDSQASGETDAPASEEETQELDHVDAISAPALGPDSNNSAAVDEAAPVVLEVTVHETSEPPPSDVVHAKFETDFDEEEVVVVERYRQPRPASTPIEDSKSRLQRLEALFGELRSEDSDAPSDSDAVANLDEVTPADTVAVTDQAEGEELAVASERADGDWETDELAQRIRGALHDLFDPRAVDLSRRVKRVTQDDLNRILATIRSTGQKGAAALVEGMLNDGQARAGDVRLLVARVVHAGADFAAILGDRTYDPSGDQFDAIVDEISADLTGTLGEATLARAFDAISNETDESEAELVARTNGIYREARRKLDELINDVAYRAFSRGARLVPDATGYLWITSSSSQPCADCEDNMLAGINPKAEAFPTGHENPPAHPGCTCVIVPVFA